MIASSAVLKTTSCSGVSPTMTGGFEEALQNAACCQLSHVENNSPQARCTWTEPTAQDKFPKSRGHTKKVKSSPIPQLRCQPRHCELQFSARRKSFLVLCIKSKGQSMHGHRPVSSHGKSGQGGKHTSGLWSTVNRRTLGERGIR